NVTGGHGRAHQVVNAPDHGVMAFGGNARAEFHQFVEVTKTSGEEILGHYRVAVGHAVHGGDEGLVVGCHPGIRQRRHVAGLQDRGAAHRDPDAASVDDPAHRL